MYLALLLLGLVVTAIGLVTVGFGIPINSFSIGNTLIVAGATLVAAGLVLIGLAVVVRQLQRIASLLAVRPARTAEIAEPALAPGARVAPPVTVPSPVRHAETEVTRPVEPVAPEARVTEPQLSEPTPPPAPAVPVQIKGPLDWLRPKKAVSSEPPVVEVADEAPLSPRPSARNGATPEPSEPKVWSPARDDAGSPPPEPRVEHPARAAPPNDRTRDTGLFDVVWPDPKSAPAPTEPARHETPAPRRSPMTERRATAPAGPSPDRSPAILKSGVIDGMAYTLYADGSIEAELPQGTLNFASVDELRAHLEKHGG